MTTARYIVGDSLTVLRSLPDASVDLVLSSPPFLALRSYLPPDHPDKAHEMGSEATPAAFLDALLEVVEESRRVLAPHGSLCFELGDTYAGSGGAGGDYGTEEPGVKALREGQPKFDGSALRNRRTRNANRASGEGRLTKYTDGRGNPDGMRDTTFQGANITTGGGSGWPLDKCLALIPESFRWMLAYGRNPFTGRITEPWRVRNVVRWCRPNPPVGALGDKFRPATSEMVVACMSAKRYFDLDAVRSNPADVKDQRYRTTNGPKNHADPAEVLTANYTQRVPSNPAGAPPLDWWEIPTEPYKGSHYATWPTALLTRPIKAMCPERVCRTCGEPSRRIVNVSYGMDGGDREARPRDERFTGGMLGGRVHNDHRVVDRATTGWTDCGHDDWRSGVVLDPFAGSGTTLSVATGHGRDAIGIDLDERNADLAAQRVGMWLTVERFVAEVAS